MKPDLRINQTVAERLREAADLLEQQGADGFRISAYRKAAETVAHMSESVLDVLLSRGVEGLIALPHIGRGIAGAILEIVQTGRWARLDALRGSLVPEQLFQSVPGVGPALAARIYDRLHVDTLEALEVAAHDGRLEEVDGVGPRRAAMIRAALHEMLSRVRPPRRATTETPEVAIMLEVDREYRDKAAAGELQTIAPKRFNPDGDAWLPILHTQRGDWHFTALFSNTARAHELERTRDWVVLYFYDHHHEEGQSTVVTETRGALTGLRVVRGREAECRAYYEALGVLEAG